MGGRYTGVACHHCGEIIDVTAPRAVDRLVIRVRASVISPAPGVEVGHDVTPDEIATLPAIVQQCLGDADGELYLHPGCLAEVLNDAATIGHDETAVARGANAADGTPASAADDVAARVRVGESRGNPAPTYHERREAEAETRKARADAATAAANVADTSGAQPAGTEAPVSVPSGAQGTAQGAPASGAGKGQGSAGKSTDGGIP